MKHKNKRKSNKSQKDYEGFQYGPFKFERYGRYIKTSTHWQEGEYKKFVDGLRTKRTEIKNKIDKNISDLILIIESYDPFELLTCLSTENCFTDPETYTELSHKGLECYVEFALSLITSHNKHGLSIHATKQVIDQFKKIIADIFNDILFYFSFETTESNFTKIESEIRFRLLLSYIFLRGASFQEHHLELVDDIFKPHNDFIKKHFGFSTEEILITVEEIENQVLYNYNKLPEKLQNMMELHQVFNNFIESKGFENFDSIENCFEEFRSLPEVLEKKEMVDDFIQALNKIPFEIIPNEKTPNELLNLLSIDLGENKVFSSYIKAPYWPTNDSQIYSKPLIKHNEKIYAFMPQLLFRNIGNILEEWIFQKDQKYFEQLFQSKRASFLENKSLEYFEKLLPNSICHNKLYYSIEEDGHRKRFETDGIILFDNNLFIIEAKAGRLSLSARRGGLKRLKDDVKEIVDSAYNQARRTKKYFEESEIPQFEHEDGTVAIRFENKEKIENIFLINITLEPLGDLSAHLNSLKKLNFIQGKEWPWSIFINDLRVISEIIDSPSCFILFLKRRIRANDFSQVNFSDELDYLMFFLKDGLYLENTQKNDNAQVQLIGYTESLDRYYDYISGRVENGDKPTLNAIPEIKELIANIEKLQLENFSKVTLSILNLSSESHKKLIDALIKIRTLSRKDHNAHDISLFFNKDSMGITFFCTCSQDISELRRIDDHCKLKMYQTKFECWIAVAFENIDEITKPYYYHAFKKKWQFNEEFEQKLEQFKKWKWEKSGLLGKKIERNQECPCGSGIKYKKCCGK